MMECTDRHYRYLVRLISRRALLYTEMIASGALLHGDRERFLDYHPSEHPLALQLGGSDPDDMARCAELAEQWGYDEVNINVGCPSDRVQSGRFGACLMLEPSLVAANVRAMRAAVGIPVTVKSRIGVDDRDSYEELKEFVAEVADAGCKTFIIHARKAYLKGLSPKQNRTVPPLHYERVYRVKQDFPELTVVINGGITDLDSAEAHLRHLDGVMIGREAYANPYMLAEVDRRFHQIDDPVPGRDEILCRYTDYCASQLKQGARLYTLTRHALGLYHGQPRARLWRRYIGDRASRNGAGIEVFREAARVMYGADVRS